MSDALGLDQTALRRVNTSVILRFMAAMDDEVGMQQIATATGLSRRTVELIVGDLVARGWAREVENERTGGVGRPTRKFAFEAARQVVVAVRIDTDFVTAAISDLRGNDLGRSVVPLGADYFDPSLATAIVTGAIHEALAAADVEAGQIGAGVVGIGGVVDDSGTMVRLVNAPLWSGYQLSAPFEREFGGTWLADNDANLSALAEHWMGASQGTPCSVYLIAGSRAGAGIVINGEVHRGAFGGAGELIESRILGLQLEVGYSLALLTSPRPADRQLGRGRAAAALAGDPQAEAEARRFAAQIADMLDVLTWTIAPHLVVLGGGLEAASELLIPLVQERLRETGSPQIELAPSLVGTDASIRGAVRRALDATDEVIFSTTRLPPSLPSRAIPPRSLQF